MSNFFFIKFKNKCLEKNIINHELNIFKSIYKPFNKNSIGISFSKKHAYCLFYSCNKKEIFEDDKNLFLLNGQPIFNSEIVNVNFFKNKTDELFDGNMNCPWTLLNIDKKTNNIFLLQNILSHKTSYYSETKDFFLLSSDLRSILKTNFIKNEIDNFFRNLFCFYNYKSVYNRGLSPIKNVYQLKFNEKISIINNKLEVKKIKNKDKIFTLNKNLKSNINVGVQRSIEKIIKNIYSPYSNSKNCISLSGGIDSAVLAYSLNKFTNRKLDSVSVIFDKKTRYDETENIKILEKKYINKNYKFIFKPKNIEDEILKIYRDFDHPISSVSFFGLQSIFKIISNLGYKNIFSGYGADPANCGYYDHYLYNLADLFKKKTSRFKKELEFWIKKHSTSEFPKNINVFKNFYKDLNKNLTITKTKPLSNYLTYINKNLDKKFPNSDFYQENILNNFSINCLQCTSIGPSKDTDQTIDLINSINTISPFSNISFMNIFLSLKNVQKINNAENKYILKKIYKNKISKKIFSSPKIGFNMPLNEWINFELKDLFMDHLLSKDCLEKIDINKRKMELLFKEHKSLKENHMMLFWQILNFYLWQKEWLNNY